jgi:hypothetical protein
MQNPSHSYSLSKINRELRYNRGMVIARSSQSAASGSLAVPGHADVIDGWSVLVVAGTIASAGLQESASSVNEQALT